MVMGTDSLPTLPPLTGVPALLHFTNFGWLGRVAVFWICWCAMVAIRDGGC
jgi:hypothetical protein